MRFYLEVVDAGSSTQGGGASAVPLVQRVPGFRAQNLGCLIFLEVLDEGHGSKHADQVVTTWTRGGRASPKQRLSGGNAPVFLGRTERGTFSLQQRGVQQLHHVLDLVVQLRQVTLSQHVGEHRKEVVGPVRAS